MYAKYYPENLPHSAKTVTLIIPHHAGLKGLFTARARAAIIRQTWETICCHAGPAIIQEARQTKLADFVMDLELQRVTLITFRHDLETAAAVHLVRETARELYDRLHLLCTIQTETGTEYL